jgi:hypothetical protein
VHAVAYIKSNFFKGKKNLDGVSKARVEVTTVQAVITGPTRDRSTVLVLSPTVLFLPFPLLLSQSASMPASQATLLLASTDNRATVICSEIIGATPQGPYACRHHACPARTTSNGYSNSTSSNSAC